MKNGGFYKSILSVFIVCFGLFLMGFNAQAAWESEQLEDDFSISGQDNVVVINSDGNPVVLYDYNESGTYRLKYAVKEGDSWTKEVILSTSESNIGWRADMVLDADDVPHVVFFQKANWEDEDEGSFIVYLKYATKVDGDWEVETISTHTDAENRPSYGTADIELDADSDPHIVYTGMSGSYDLNYAYWEGGVWNFTLDLDNNLGCEDAVFEFDALDQPHIVTACRDNYHSCGEESCHDSVLYHTYLSGGNWQLFETVDSNEDLTTSGYDYFKHLSMVMDEEEQFYVLYHDMNNNSLKFASNPGNVWAAETVDDNFVPDDTSPLNIYFKNSIALDSDSNPHITYYNFKTNNLKYAVKEDGEWGYRELFAVPWENEGGLPSITVDDSNRAHISYIGLSEGSDYAVRYAHSIPGIIFATKSKTALGAEKVVSENNSYLKGKFAFTFMNLPSKLQEDRYYIKLKKYNKYPIKNFEKKKKKAIKRYWRITSNLRNYNAGNDSNEFRLRLMFAYPQRLVKVTKNNNSKLKEKQLKLKYYSRADKKWMEVTQSKQDTKRNLFYVNMTDYNFPKKTLFTIAK
ncbi:MAG: hypothetical protein ABID45_03460 [Patescibacteria group bacterium]